MQRSTRSPIPVLVVLVATILTACVGRSSSPPEGAPSTRPPGPSGPPSAVAAPTVAASDGVVTDPRGDVVDPSGGAPEDPVPAADLVAVDVTVTDGEVTVRFELAGPPPAEVGSLLWSVRTERNGEPVLTISAQQVGPEVFAAVYDWRSQQQRQAPVRVDGRTVTVTVPRDGLDGLGTAWSALVQLDGAFEDTTLSVPLDR